MNCGRVTACTCTIVKCLAGAIMIHRIREYFTLELPIVEATISLRNREQSFNAGLWHMTHASKIYIS